MYKATANLLIVCFLCWMTGCSSTHTASEDLVPTDYVNPFIGASTSVGAAGVEGRQHEHGRHDGDRDRGLDGLSGNEIGKAKQNCQYADLTHHAAMQTQEHIQQGQARLVRHG